MLAKQKFPLKVQKSDTNDAEVLFQLTKKTHLSVQNIFNFQNIFICSEYNTGTSRVQRYMESRSNRSLMLYVLSE